MLEKLNELFFLRECITTKSDTIGMPRNGVSSVYQRPGKLFAERNNNHRTLLLRGKGGEREERRPGKRTSRTRWDFERVSSADEGWSRLDSIGGQSVVEWKLPVYYRRDFARCMQPKRTRRTRTREAQQKLLLISSPAQLAMFHRQELTRRSLNRVVARENFQTVIRPSSPEGGARAIPFISRHRGDRNNYPPPPA